MSGFTVREGDHLDKVDGQTVNCQGAAHFYVTPSIPVRPEQRFLLGAQLGAGFACGLSMFGILFLGALRLIALVFA
jgi:hypothetical protein